MKFIIFFKTASLKIKKFFYWLKLNNQHFQPNFQPINIKTVENSFSPLKTTIYNYDVFNHLYTSTNLNNNLYPQPLTNHIHRCYPYPLHIED